MAPARGRRDDPRETRLLTVDPAHGRVVDGRIGDLPRLLAPHDVLVVNDAATLPASLRGVAAGGAPIELRLAGEDEGGRWVGVLLGDGDWRTPTEHRPAPPALAVGARLGFDGLTATVVAVDPAAPRLVTVAFDGGEAEFWRGLYRVGRAVQYAYARAPLSLWDVQTAYAGRPWAVEPPSAGIPLSFELLVALRRAGVGLAHVTHAAGLSSTGDAELDRRLPLPERYWVGAPAVRAIAEARARGGRVIAAGTSVVRALEGAALAHGELAASAGVTALRIGPATALCVVDGLLSGQHELGSSHFDLTTAFADPGLLARAHEHAVQAGYRGHEFGDAVLILPRGMPGEREPDARRRRPPSTRRPSTSTTASASCSAFSP